MFTSVLLREVFRMIVNHGRHFIVLSLVFSAVSCKREIREIVVTDTAEIKRIEASERRASQDAILAANARELEEKSEMRRAEEAKAELEMQKAEAERQAARDSLLAAEVHKQAAKAKQMEQEAQLARERLAREKELAEQKKALEAEVAAIAAASNTINVFVADLRFRQGQLQLKLERLPDEIKDSRADAAYLTEVLASCRQGVVTNVRYALDGKAKLMDIQTVTRKPDEYVKAIKADPKINKILARYNNEMFAFELDKVVEQLAYENKRLSTSWEMLNKGKATYNSKLVKANTGTRATTSGLKAELDKVESRIKILEFRIKSLRNGFRDPSAGNQIRQAMDELGTDAAYSKGLYAERARLKQMLDLSSNTEQQADASTSGITSNFGLQEKALRDEYEANIRQAFDNVERTVLHTVTQKKDDLEQELESAQSDLAAIQLILDAHTKGQISRNDMVTLHSKFTNSVSGSLSLATDRILK